MNGFIIGTGRCGTTMLASILNSHSQICVPPETQLLCQYAGNGAGLHELFEAGAQFDGTAEQFIGYVQKRCPHKLHEYFDYASYFQAQHYPVTRLKEFMGDFYAAIATAKNKSICIEQTPWYGQRIDVLEDLFPTAKYIHMVRDGRDVAISFSRTPWWHNNIEHNLVRWAAEVDRIQRLSNRMLSPERILTVRYEDFVDAPHAKLEEICSFLGVAYEPSMLDAQDNIDYHQLGKMSSAPISSLAMNQWRAEKQSPVFKDSVQAWRNFAGYDFAATPAHVKECLARQGYGA